MRTYPRGSRFLPTELGLVKLHLKDKVEKNISGFIKTLNVYGDAPWLLHHDTNPLYSRNEWYYFVPRTIRGVKTVSRMVPSNGESLGGTWKSIGKRKEIKKKDKELMGYKTVLVFNKNVAGELEKKKTDWHMDEYSLHRNGDEFHDLVLCHVRLLYSAERFKPHVPTALQVDVKNDDNNNDVVLPNQEQQEAGFAKLEQEAGDVNQPQQQQQEQQEEQEDYILVDRHLRSNHNQIQYLLEDIVNQNGRVYVNQHQQQQQEQEDSPDPLLLPPLQSNDNQERHPLDDIAFDGADDNLTIDIDELLKILDEGKEQEDSPTLPLPPPLQSNVNQEPCLSWDTNYVPSQVENNYNNNTILQNQEQQEAGFANHYDMTMMVEKEHGDIKQQYQQQQDQEQQHIDLQSLLYDPEWHDLCFMPPLQSDDNHGQRPLVPSQVESYYNNNTVLPNQEQREAGFANQNDMTMMVAKEHDSITHNPDGSLTQQQLQKLEIFIDNLNLSF
ncbi:unnamed protein product [Brassica napus]|uniref:(rape) hypothetical protein n=1 Tax=Brassica napus TaxID=3708 RepID=A0A816L0I9_BRANA|nr:unnamed protein product [Brassica napus]